MIALTEYILFAIVGWSSFDDDVDVDVDDVVRWWDGHSVLFHAPEKRRNVLGENFSAKTNKIILKYL